MGTRLQQTVWIVLSLNPLTVKTLVLAGFARL